MPRKRFAPEDIVVKSRRIDVLMSRGKSRSSSQTNAAGPGIHKRVLERLLRVFFWRRKQSSR